jgi:hypothetical protein
MKYLPAPMGGHDAERLENSSGRIKFRRSKRITAHVYYRWVKYALRSHTLFDTEPTLR